MSSINHSGNQPTDGFESIGDILQTTISQWVQGAGQPISRIWELWEKTVGETVAQNAQPARLKNGVLIVHVASSTWTQQLRYLKNDMISALNNAAGSDLVSDIQFKIGELTL